MCVSTSELCSMSSASSDHGSAGRETPCAVLHAVVPGGRPSVRKYGQCASAICRDACGEPTIFDASERLSDGLPRLFCSISVPPAERSKVWCRDTVFHRREQSLQRPSTHRHETTRTWPAGTGQLHFQPVHGRSFKRRIPAVFRRRDPLPSSGRAGSQLWPLRLRHPTQSQCSICLSVADQSPESPARIRVERLASVRKRLLAQWRSVFRAQHVLFGGRKRHPAGWWAAVRRNRCWRTAL